jgi:flagellar biosynthesis GTPase FlhF
VQHKRKGHYRGGRYVQPTWVNKGIAGAGRLALFAGKAGLEFAKRKREEANKKAEEKREADRKEKERLEEAGISKPKEGLVSRAVHVIPGTRAVEERSKKQAFQEAQRHAKEERLNQEKLVFEAQKKKELEVKP